MAVGVCRHCGAERVATDAPLCFTCGGWWPNPGFVTKCGVWLTRLFALAFIAVGVLGVLALYSNPSNPDSYAGYIAPLLGLGGALMLLRSLVRPYGGRPPNS